MMMMMKMITMQSPKRQCWEEREKICVRLHFFSWI